jgi:hypothetical protein
MKLFVLVGKPPNSERYISRIVGIDEDGIIQIVGETEPRASRKVAAAEGFALKQSLATETDPNSHSTP